MNISKSFILYSKIANLFCAYNNCVKSGNNEYKNIHEDALNQLVKDNFPSGSGFDKGTKFNWEKSSRNKLVFNISFHHMDDNGYYCGWTDHEVIITPDLVFQYDIRVTGKNYRDIKEYIGEVFSSVGE